MSVCVTPRLASGRAPCFGLSFAVAVGVCVCSWCEYICNWHLIDAFWRSAAHHHRSVPRRWLIQRRICMTISVWHGIVAVSEGLRIIIARNCRENINIGSVRRWILFYVVLCGSRIVYLRTVLPSLPLVPGLGTHSNMATNNLICRLNTLIMIIRKRYIRVRLK